MKLDSISLFPLIALVSIVPSVLAAAVPCPAGDEAQIGMSSSNDFGVAAGLTRKLLPCTIPSLEKLRPPLYSGHDSRGKVQGLQGLCEVQARLLAVLFCGM